MVTVDTLYTTNTTPTITGTVTAFTGSTIAWVHVTVHGVEYNATLAGGTWSVDIPTALPEDDYNVLAQARDSLNREGTDSTTNELRVDATPPDAAFTLIEASPTTSDTLTFGVQWTESVGATFAPEDVTIEGDLAGTVQSVEQSGPENYYVVTVQLDDTNADGFMGIGVLGAGAITDLVGNGYAGGSSPQYTVRNWFGFASEPSGIYRAYTGAHVPEFTFSVEPDSRMGSSTPAYQWWFDDGNKAGPAPISGATSPALTIDPVQFTDAGDYWCVVTYFNAGFETTHGTLLVADHLLIVPPLPAGGQFNGGESHTFSVVWAGGFEPLSFQWKKDGLDITGATDSDYTIASLASVDSGVYQVEIRDSGTDIVTSQDIDVSVSAGVPAAGLLGLTLLTLAGAFGGTNVLRRRKK
jgi:hypothetical protein